jgi:hypothetical protein
MKYYTLILELNGGTYISQIHADAVENVLALWVERISNQDIPEMNEQLKDAFRHELENGSDEPVLLKGLQNAWCSAFSVNDQFFLFNIVETVV